MIRRLTSTEDSSTVDLEQEARAGCIDETLLDDLDRPESDPVLPLGDRSTISELQLGRDVVERLFSLSNGPPELDIAADPKVPFHTGLAVGVDLDRLGLDRLSGLVRQGQFDGRVFEGVRDLDLGSEFGGLEGRVEDSVDPVARNLRRVGVYVDGFCSHSMVSLERPPNVQVYRATTHSTVQRS